MSTFFCKPKRSCSRIGTVIDYRNWHLGLGRRFRSLKLWFVLRGFGLKGMHEHIRRVDFFPPSKVLIVWHVPAAGNTDGKLLPDTEFFRDLNVRHILFMGFYTFSKKIG